MPTLCSGMTLVFFLILSFYNLTYCRPADVPRRFFLLSPQRPQFLSLDRAWPQAASSFTPWRRLALFSAIFYSVFSRSFALFPAHPPASQPILQTSFPPFSLGLSPSALAIPASKGSCTLIGMPFFPAFSCVFSATLCDRVFIFVPLDTPPSPSLCFLRFEARLKK